MVGYKGSKHVGVSGFYHIIVTNTIVSLFWLYFVISVYTLLLLHGVKDIKEQLFATILGVVLYINI
jgi:hypothetical protein